MLRLAPTLTEPLVAAVNTAVFVVVSLSGADPPAQLPAVAHTAPLVPLHVIGAWAEATRPLAPAARPVMTPRAQAMRLRDFMTKDAFDASRPRRTDSCFPPDFTHIKHSAGHPPRRT